MGLMPGFENDEEDEGDDESGNGNGKKREKKNVEEEPPQAPVDPLLAAMLATVVFDTTPLPAAAVNPLDDSGRSLLKLAPVKAFPSVRFFFFNFFSFFFWSRSKTDTQNSPPPLSFLLFLSLNY